MAGDRNPTKAAQWLACMLNAGLLAGAVGVVAAEGLDLNRDGAFTVHEALLVLVRLLAFPVHVLLQLTPAPVLQLLGCRKRPGRPRRLWRWRSAFRSGAFSSAVCSWSRLGSGWLGRPPKATGGRSGRPDWPSAGRARSRRSQAGCRADGGGSVHLHFAAASPSLDVPSPARAPRGLARVRGGPLQLSADRQQPSEVVLGGDAAGQEPRAGVVGAGGGQHLFEPAEMCPSAWCSSYG